MGATRRTSEALPAAATREAALPPGDLPPAADAVDEALIETFPASDPPGTQPLHPGGPDRKPLFMATRPFATPPPFEQTVRVVMQDLDERAHVNNVVYLRWVQDIATAHWQAFAPPAASVDLAWVALRHEIDYHAPAVLGDELTIATWVGGAEGLRFERFTEVRRASDGLVLARARTLWCPVDAATGRPQRVSATVRELFSDRPVP